MTRAEKISATLRKRYANKPPLPGLATMKAAAQPGECPFCDGSPNATNRWGRKAHTCGAPECVTAWMRCYQRDRRVALKEAPR